MTDVSKNQEKENKADEQAYGFEIAHFLPECAPAKLRLENIRAVDEAGAIEVAARLVQRSYKLAGVSKVPQVKLDTCRLTDSTTTEHAIRASRAGAYVISPVECRSFADYVQDMTLWRLGKLPGRSTCVDCNPGKADKKSPSKPDVTVHVKELPAHPSLCLRHRYLRWNAKHTAVAKLTRIFEDVGGNQEAMLNEWSNPKYSADETQD